MKRILFACTCLFAEISALEYEKQFENEKVLIAKVKLAPYEEVGLHRDALPQVVVALQGGTITRLEPDGRKVDVHFPTGQAVYRPVDPENELHRSVNNGATPVELIITQLKTDTPAYLESRIQDAQSIAVDIRINCALCPEYTEFVNSIPSGNDSSAEWADWKTSFIDNMTKLIKLVESDQVYESMWFVNPKAREST